MHEEVILQLIKSKCVPSMVIYDLEVCMPFKKIRH